MRRAPLLLTLGLLGCPPADEPPPLPTPVYDGTFEVPADPVVCADPVQGIDRFSQESQERGLVVIQPPNPGGDDDDDGGPQFASGLAGPRLAAQDIDGDGDIDVLAAEQSPLVYLNDGTGHFTLGERAPFLPYGGLMGIMAADLDGDHLPEVLGASAPIGPTDEGAFAIWPNLGGGVLGEPTIVKTGFVGRDAEPCSIELGDIDGDGDLDLHYCTRNSMQDAGGSKPELIYFNEGGEFSNDRRMELTAYEGWGVTSLVATFTDFDLDGDQDLFVIGGEPTWGFPEHPGSGLYRNDGNDADGRPILSNVAGEYGLDASFSAMGVDSADLDQDGLPDYCMTDVGPVRCFLSNNGGQRIDGGLDLGLTPEDPVLDFPETIGWSLDFRDIDNDGLVDVLQSSAPDHGGIWGGTDAFPDLLWRQLPGGGFDDITAETSFGSDAQHIGMVSADFDDNGAIDVLFQAEFWDDIPLLLMNRCGEGHWINVELRGPPDNSEGVGAWFRFEYGDRHEIRELYTMRATTQNPTRMHQGLGASVVVDKLEVHWPDGIITVAENVPTDRVVTAVHPAAE